MRRNVPLSLLLGFVCFLCACNNEGEPAATRSDSGVLHISADESFQPVIDAQIQVYEAQNPDVKIVAHYKSEAECIKDFLVDSIRMVIITRGFSERERQTINDSLKVGPVAITMAYDAVAVVVHPAAPDSFFTLPALRDLVSGKTKKSLIPVFDGVTATSTVRFMLDSVLRGQPLGPNVVAAKSSRGVLDYVAQTPNAVGFLGVSWIGDEDDSLQQTYRRQVQVARMESADSAGYYVLPAQYLIYTRAYPLVRDLVCVLKEKEGGLANGFAAFMRGDRGQLLFRRSYLYPAFRPFYVRDTELR